MISYKIDLACLLKHTLCFTPGAQNRPHKKRFWVECGGSRLTSTPSTIFMMNWNADCEPHRPTLETELMNKSEPSSYFRLLHSHGSLSSLPDTVYTSAAPFFSFGWCTFKLSALCSLFLCRTPAAPSLTLKLSCQLHATCCCLYSFL